MAIPEKIHKALHAKANGSIVAPAGYGKTETIADIVAGTSDRCLLLTHTLAGVDALRKRLREKGVKSHRYQLEPVRQAQGLAAYRNPLRPMRTHLLLGNLHRSHRHLLDMINES